MSNNNILNGLKNLTDSVVQYIENKQIGYVVRSILNANFRNLYNMIKNLGEHKKGYFSTVALLKSTHPNPSNGDYAYVGATWTVWEVKDGAWVDTKKPIPEDYIEKNELQQLKDRLYAEGNEEHIEEVISSSNVGNTKSELKTLFYENYELLYGKYIKYIKLYSEDEGRLYILLSTIKDHNFGYVTRIFDVKQGENVIPFEEQLGEDTTLGFGYLEGGVRLRINTSKENEIGGNIITRNENAGWDKIIGDLCVTFFATVPENERGDILKLNEEKADEVNENGAKVLRENQIEPEGTFFTDDAGNIGFWLDSNNKFRAKTDYAECSYILDGTGNTYFVDELGNIGFYITETGQFIGNITDVISITSEFGKSEKKAISQDFFTQKYWELRFLIDGTLPPQEYDVVHIIVLGQSLTMGYGSNPVLSELGLDNAIMFSRTRTQGLSDANYTQFNQLKEIQVGSEGETPCSGVAQGMNLASLEKEGFGIPYKMLLTAPGIGGTQISEFGEGTSIFNKCMQDIQRAKSLCDSLGLTYKVGIINWGQGEQNYATSIASYKTSLNNLVALYNQKIKELTGQKSEIPFVSYQTAVKNGSVYNPKTQYPALAQWELAQENPLFFMAAPIYNLPFIGDKVHITNIASRLLGNSLGRINYRVLKGDYTLFKPIQCLKAGNVVSLSFDRKISFDSQTLQDSGVDLSDIKDNAGFFSIDTDGNLLTATTVLNEDEKSITITCSGEPVKLYYGFKSPDTFTSGGLVREKEQLEAFNTTKLSLYMPNQIINL